MTPIRGSDMETTVIGFAHCDCTVEPSIDSWRHARDLFSKHSTHISCLPLYAAEAYLDATEEQ